MVVQQALAFIGLNSPLDTGPQLRPAKTALLPHEDQLLDRFTAEIEAAAASCAVLLTYRTAAVCGYEARLPRPHETLLPYVPLTVPAVAESSFAREMTATRRSILRRMPDYLAQSKTAMEHVLGNVDIPAHNKLASAVEAGYEPLKAGAAFVTVTLDDLAGLPDFAHRPALTLSLRRLRGALLSALDGGTPLLTDGVIELPDTSIVIRGMRRSVDIEAKMSSYGRSWKVRVLNISQGGYCVSGADGLATGSVARLQLNGGRVLDGSVKWNDGNRAGVRLSSRLLLADPLLNQ